MLKLIDVNEENWRTPLKVAEHQKEYVANSTVILARAYAYRNQRSRAFIIYDDKTPIGMGLYHDSPDIEAYIFSEIFIDEKYQGRGYGKAAAKLVLDDMRSDGRFKKVILCYIEGNKAAKKMYESLGFTEIDRDEDEIVMELCL